VIEHTFIRYRSWQSLQDFLKILALILLGVLAGVISTFLATTFSLVVVVSVLGSYALRRYEVENSSSHSFAQGSANLLSRLLGMGGEAAAVCVCIVLYPFGYFRCRYSQAQFQAGERPLILCHGYMTNRSSLLWLARQFEKSGRRNIIIPNFLPASASITDFAKQLGNIVQLARERAGVDKVDVLGHSMGGLVVRYYVEQLGGDAFVDTAVTLGAPHKGTKTAVFGLFDTARQFLPTAAFIKDLKVARPVQDVKMISIWSEFDNIVLPPENALLPQPYENVMVKNVGHVALLFSAQAINQARLAFSGSLTAS
jgi:pimeloyl-ACP methyl ester carboxylesterase